MATIDAVDRAIIDGLQGGFPICEVVNGFREVAHNYRRESDRNCAFNMWFVLATESADGIAAAVRGIEEASGLPVFPFPKLKEYFVEMKLAVRA